ncbi:MAG: restriction endonuclease subunit S [bacterium]
MPTPNPLQNLINQLCPNGVEFKELGEVILSLKTGLNPRKNFVLNSPNAKNYYITVRELSGFNVNFLEKTDRVDDEALKLINNRSNLEAGDVLFSGTGTIGRTALVRETPKNWNIKEGVYVIKPDSNVLNSGFLLYYLNSANAKDIYEKKIVGSPVASIPMSDLKKLKIPIPPLAVQQEIVRILDSFIELESELESELEARKKQYDWHFNLLMQNNNYKEYKLSDLCTIQSGGTPSKAEPIYWENGTINWLGSTVCKNQKTVTEITAKITEEGLKKSSAKLQKKDTTLIALVGATIGKVAFLPFEASINQNMSALYPLDLNELNPSYLYYICRSKYSLFTDLANEKFAMANLSFVKNLKVNLPPLLEQERIVAILDKFDALVNNISIGLPAELKARRQQYEYYRNELLSFEETVK